ncbi:MAG: hypothetical protein JO101_08915 [Candidatus Eremiobacteraeota bacterium]|nr:hypothetical protein [Candidatus Eremiobacteraeota bacterium]MBV8355426.1 hypothetical protein [Candidatus Eremiobacteraeota bacterium]
MEEDTDNVADMLNRGQFLAPSLIGDGGDSPLLDQARRNVADTVARAKRKQAEREQGIVHDDDDDLPKGRDNRQ